jgi:uncharacterized protein YjbJ (UPF0337 family)
MKRAPVKRSRPDIAAAVRGGDWTQAMDGEGVPGHATMEEALYWRQIYTEILGKEEKVLKRIHELMAAQSGAARRAEVELTNVPVVVAQVERFRQRLGYWEARVHELNGAVPPPRGRGVLATTLGNSSLQSSRPTLLYPNQISQEVFMKDQVRGKAEEIKGKVTGNRTEETKGKLRQQVGKAKSTVRDLKEDVRNEANRNRTSR